MFRLDAKPGSKSEAKKLGVQRDSLVETADDSESRGFDRSRTGHHPRQQLASRVHPIIQPKVLPCQGRVCSFRGF